MLGQSGIAVSAWDGLAELGAQLSKRVGLLMMGQPDVGVSPSDICQPTGLLSSWK